MMSGTMLMDYTRTWTESDLAGNAGVIAMDPLAGLASQVAATTSSASPSRSTRCGCWSS